METVIALLHFLLGFQLFLPQEWSSLHLFATTNNSEDGRHFCTVTWLNRRQNLNINPHFQRCPTANITATVTRGGALSKEASCVAAHDRANHSERKTRLERTRCICCRLTRNNQCAIDFYDYKALNLPRLTTFIGNA